ncbi:MAG: NrfJ-related protein [Gammaproteobacteria bacterium]|nr:NrfJ-related protein [Gammaproteobacteria bacterium]MDH5801820.1 NrfJ-related protein [Gammaproteobacteria bacterium]
MNVRLCYLAACVVLIPFLNACSDGKDAAEQSSAQTTAQTPATQALISASPTLPTNGKVVKAMHASGYTYMQVENEGKLFWVAAKMMNVRRNDYVSWQDPSLQRNFNSPTLRKTFDEILFVASATVDK